MNGCFRAVWLTLLFTLFLLTPGAIPLCPDGSSHASEKAPPVIIPIQPPASTQPEVEHPVPVTAPRREGPMYAVQAAACRQEQNARNIAVGLKEKGYEPILHSWEDASGNLWHSVFLGVYADAAEAGSIAGRYREREGGTVFIKTLDGYVPAVKTVEKADLPVYRPPAAPAPVRDEGVPEEPREIPEGRPEIADEKGVGPGFTCSGFVEFESVVNTEGDGSFRKRNKKNEIRNRLQMKYGTEELFFYSVSNLYLLQTYLDKRADDYQRYAKDQHVSRNLRLSSQEAELSFDELYLNYGRGTFRMRLGNQIYGWGTADAFNPTSYFNPDDMREIVFKDDDENTVGVPSLSGMFFLGDYTLEAVFVPVHIAPIMAPEGTFWAIDPDGGFVLPIVLGGIERVNVDFDDPEQLGGGIANVGYGARLSISRVGVDMSLSGYRGPDKNQLFIPYSLAYQGTTAVLQVRPQTFIVTMFGFDISAALGDFVVQFEAAYSPDKMGIVEQSATTLAGLTLPFETDRAHFFSYAAGFNYFIPMDRLIEGHTGNSVFTFEWFKSRYLEDGLYAPLITDIVSCKFEDSYLDGRIKTTIKGIFDMKHGGKIFWPEIGYDFQNGFLVELGYAAIWTEKGSAWEDASLFYYFKDNDMVMLKLRYRY
ncbi:MAG: SPOR domain-containing protein [Deltaproteobacteria bacterium]|nr:SPOR domain-containing protein [Deltaproteobacteria bacterium]